MPEKHDPIAGPWRVQGWENTIVNDANGWTVVAFPGGGPGYSLSDVQARALLIGAGPNMLTALLGLIEWDRRESSEAARGESVDWDAFDAAMQKAREAAAMAMGITADEPTPDPATRVKGETSDG